MLNENDKVEGDTLPEVSSEAKIAQWEELGQQKEKAIIESQLDTIVHPLIGFINFYAPLASQELATKGIEKVTSFMKECFGLKEFMTEVLDKIEKNKKGKEATETETPPQ